MTDPSNMYRWRKLSKQQQKEILKSRQSKKLPWHSPPHYENGETTFYMVTVACYEHRHAIGFSPSRMEEFELLLVELLREHCDSLFAWTVLPSHYHVVIDANPVKHILRQLGKLHGRTSFQWNGQENSRGRKVWSNATETAMKSDGHFFASLNYVWHNAVHHGYVQKWDQWPYSNASGYLERVGRDKAAEVWRQFPLYDDGKDWNPVDM